MSVIVHQKESEMFVEALKSIGAGELVAKCAKEMAKAIQASTLSNKPTSLTLKLDFKPSGKELLSIRGSCKAIVPVEKEESSFFVSAAFLPTRERPEQLTMFKD